MPIKLSHYVNARCIVAAASVLGLLLCALPAPTAQAQQLTLRFHTHVPPVAGSYKALVGWAKKVEAESGGTLKIQMFGSMQLGGKAPDIYDQIRNGVVDLGFTLPGYKAGLFPAITVFELPFIGGRALVAAPAVDAFARKYGKEWRDVHPILVWSAGTSVLHMKTRPIRTLEDFKGLKIRTPSRISSAALTALGSTPVPIPGLKMTEAMMRNVVDGVVTPWSIALAIRTVDVAKYHTETTLHGPVLAILMNKKSYAKLPAKAKAALDANSGEGLAKAMGLRWETDDKKGLGKAKKLGHEIIRVSAAEQARWRKAAQPAYDNWIKEMNGRGLPGARMVKDAEALIAKYKAELKK
ncbi:MAG: TRAP transporter substrate-binding protein [Proteobacteria bacterium]|nr:TRAP transporter substrate-binding protein [Pseudomonadota bacterium]MDA1324951.1 TRAP transporter substrate-binding protein [Pseudomonadota bacterium]